MVGLRCIPASWYMHVAWKLSLSLVPKGGFCLGFFESGAVEIELETTLELILMCKFEGRG